MHHCCKSFSFYDVLISNELLVASYKITVNLKAIFETVLVLVFGCYGYTD